MKPTIEPCRCTTDGRACDGYCRLMFEGAPVGFLRALRDGTVIRINDALAEMLRFPTADDARNRRLGDLTGERTDVESWFAVVGENPATDIRQIRFHRRDGGVFWGLVHAWPALGDADGRPCLACTVQDITRWKNAEEELRQGEHYFRSLVENVSDNIATVDQQGRFRFLSPSIEDMFGYRPEDLIGRSLFEFVRDEDGAAVADGLRSVFAQPEHSRPLRFQARHRDGSWRELESLCKPLPSEAGQTAAVVTSRDVTEQRRLQAALRASEARYRTFFGQSLMGNFITTPDGQIVACNEAFAEIFGFSSVEAAQRANVGVTDVDPRSREEILEELRREGRLQRVEATRRRIDGLHVHVIETLTGRFDAKGELCEIWGCVLDETLHKQLEAELRQSQRLESIGSLAGGVAHDFNNILTSIIGYSQIALSKLPPHGGPRPEILEVLRAGHRAASLTRQLLAFGRRQVLKPEILALDAVVEDLEKMLRRLIPENVVVTTKACDSRCLVSADRSQIEQVVMNLVVNARDAMPAGGTIGIRTDVTEVGPGVTHDGGELAPGTYARLVVTDQGCGMDADTRSRIFEPFFTTKPVGEGTGLGLSTVYGIVRQSGGCITVESEVGVGSTFEVYLPLVEGAATSSPAMETRPLMPRGTETILVVEDDPAVRRLLTRTLREQGYGVLEAPDGLHALELAAECPEDGLDLLLADLVVPLVNGRDLAETLAERFARLKVLYASGYDHDPTAHGAVLRAGVAMLRKPYTPAELARKVRDLLDEPGRSRA